jgi:hypothetical protein
VAVVCGRQAPLALGPHHPPPTLTSIPWSQMQCKNLGRDRRARAVAVGRALGRSCVVECRGFGSNVRRWRFCLPPSPQDAHILDLGLHQHPDCCLFAVFDGHGGDASANATCVGGPTSINTPSGVVRVCHRPIPTSPPPPPTPNDIPSPSRRAKRFASILGKQRTYSDAKVRGPWGRAQCRCWQPPSQADLEFPLCRMRSSISQAPEAWCAALYQAFFEMDRYLQTDVRARVGVMTHLPKRAAECGYMAVCGWAVCGRVTGRATT